MQRLVDLLATTEHRVIVSKGPLADQIKLHDNQTGEGFLPQPAILPQVDLVITHGGNNTVTEAFHHGKPMIVLPLFWDQVDNAQRVDETGFGRRLSTYGFRDEELTGAIDELLADEPLGGAPRGDVGAIKSTSGDASSRAARPIIERVAATGRGSASPPDRTVGERERPGAGGGARVPRPRRASTHGVRGDRHEAGRAPRAGRGRGASERRPPGPASRLRSLAVGHCRDGERRRATGRGGRGSA